MAVSAIILAAGESKRFGEKKLLAKINGKYVFQYVLEKCSLSDFDEIIFVGNTTQMLEIVTRFGAKFVLNENFKSGQGSSIRAGINAAKKFNSYMFFVADQPFLSQQTILTLLLHEKTFGGFVIVPKFGDKTGNPVIYPNYCRELLLNINDNCGGKTILSHCENVMICDIFCDETNRFESFDIDTLEDYYFALLNFSDIVIVRGGGDLASGIAAKLFNSGFRVIITESEKPSSIRRNVCFSEAVYDLEASVEGILAVFAANELEVFGALARGKIPVIIDAECSISSEIGVFAVVDATMSKKDKPPLTRTAPIHVGIGPGFFAGGGNFSADFIIETQRGHNLGRIISNGAALKNTGEPAEIGGFGTKRIVRSPSNGNFVQMKKIGDIVQENDIIGKVNMGNDEVSVFAPMTGVLRGVIRDGFEVFEGMKIGDIDPRSSEVSNCSTISDKSNAIAGGVLECLLNAKKRRLDCGYSFRYN